MRKAFTLIEVIMSVIIVSIVVMGAMELQSKNRDMAVYIAQRGNSELDNSLFLTKKIYRYDKDEKDAYELLRDEFSIQDDDSREILKSITKNINITEDKEIPISMEEGAEPIFTFYTNEVLLKGKYPARYYNFK
ncbi:MAG TPA: prepilin-type N-terminal cleavage/methylation domain-containing protein [Campylobacterales bacterium]|nr:prepilin-type N-terminal cleavage/methylation domain-containing protein [Campylobacterales bacterium]HHD81171.1 prepilin-type N-terminal cleavage/methylation domain-containing protein [Campylobacterales bacterium]HHH51327.1 prepilin-type N-terminal cleavage/methylation domain-containing protein [Campylobacterales bacterium]